MTKREVARVLRAALRLMNNNGEHWLKHSLQEGRGKGRRFCAVGGLNATLGRSNRDGGAYRLTAENRPVFVALANAIRAERWGEPLDAAATDEEITDEIVEFNDAENTVWADMQRVFRAAAKKPVTG